MLRTIAVHGIFDRQDIIFDLTVSPFFLVGPNGTGKSTALKILHNILTAQWDRLDAIPFNDVELTFTDDNVAVFERGEFKRIQRLATNLTRLQRRQGRKPAEPYPLDWDLVRTFLSGVPVGGVRYNRRMSSAAIDTYADMYPVAARLLNFVETVSRGRVLYFPTYRRVERDLRELLEDDDPFATSDEINITPEIVDRFTSSGEVVGFGGQDISALLKDTATRIGVEARQVLNDHSVRFFEVLSTERSDQTKRARDLVRSVSKSHALLDRIAAFSDIPIDRKVVEDTLQAIREKLSKAKPGRPTQPQEMMLLYIGEMITLLEKIDSLSSPLQNFANLINRYLRPVKTAFLRASDNKVVILDRSSNEIEPDMLSSGEKQILSMFAFLLLKKSFTARFIIIDEPELSLSVSWQKTLIADLLLAAGSTYLVSATHSPYIFQHFNPKNVKSLGQL